MEANNAWWLNRFIDPDARKDWMKQSFTHNGWTAATDSRTLIAVRGECPLLASPLAEPKAAGVIGNLLNDPPYWNTVSRSALAGFCGGIPVKKNIPCTFCKGSGQVEHVCGCDLCDADKEDCPECDGKKTVEAIEEREGLIDGELFDLIRMATLLAYTPPSETLRIFIPGSGKPAKFECDEWRAIVMPKTKASPEPEYARFLCDKHTA